MTTVNHSHLAPTRHWLRLEPTQGPECYHGGAFFDRVGVDFRTLGNRRDIINADVLDAWFPPAPGVMATLADHLEWTLRTSPPTQCDGFLDAIAEARGIPRQRIVAGAGSSDLIFRAFTRWLTPASSVLLLDPTYGEYHHVMEHVIGCGIDRFALDAATGYRVNLDELGARIVATRPDLVVLVNPNNPTGQHVARAELEAFLERMPERTRFWIDEAYLDYIDPHESLESFAASSSNVIVCKSMSKVYALSGVRAAYLCASTATAAEIRRVTPPWVVGLPAQIASVCALRDPQYYRGRYAETHSLRHDLAVGLEDLGLTTIEGKANSVLCTLRPGHPGAAVVVARAQKRGVFLRDISSMTSRPSERVFRVAVKNAAENATIRETLRDILG